MSRAGPPPPSVLERTASYGRHLVHVWKKEIWSTAHMKDTSVRGWGYAFLRVVSITYTVFFETKVPSRAAALSFSSLLGLGPLIAIAVLIGGFLLGKNDDPQIIANQIGALLEQAAPQLRSLQNAAGEDVKIGEAVNTPVVEMLSGFVTSARSGYGGAFGAFSLIFIVLLMFKAVEDAFNDIWGIRLSRSLLMRIVFYWTILTLGAVLFFGSVTLLGAGAALNVFDAPIVASMSKLPGGESLVAVLRWSVPMFSLTLLIVMLTLVYRVIPNTHVFWRAAFAGAFVVAALLMLNNFVAFFYVRRVVQTQNLYGQLAVPLVLMLGLYVFWLYILIGGVISYAVQNVHFRNSQAAWGQLTESMRERLSLVVLLTIGRRFHDCLPPVTASQLGDLLKVPTQIINECLNRLVHMNLITTLRPAADTPATEHRYQPARPLGRINLHDFKTLDDNLGDDPVGQALERIDPILHHYDEALGEIGTRPFFKKSLEELFAEFPFDESRPPFTLGEKRPV
ncbi:MAG: YihY/virulence factor BrkB family protein [Verrucomicrobia bacterium]|nr:YihY/virulence factor BrkB family protein [Verrucomicrobiota bacterium]